EKSNQSLEINFHSNPYINDTTFAEGSLSNIKRPTRIVFSYNCMTYFNEKAFRPFLDSDPNNYIEVDMSGLWLKFNCSDCRNAWLGKNKKKYEKKVTTIYCLSPPNETIFTHDWKNCK